MCMFVFRRCLKRRAGRSTARSVRSCRQAVPRSRLPPHQPPVDGCFRVPVMRLLRAPTLPCLNSVAGSRAGRHPPRRRPPASTSSRPRTSGSTCLKTKRAVEAGAGAAVAVVVLVAVVAGTEEPRPGSEATATARSRASVTCSVAAAARVRKRTPAGSPAGAPAKSVLSQQTQTCPLYRAQLRTREARTRPPYLPHRRLSPSRQPRAASPPP